MILEHILIFGIGAFGYGLIEILWRGYTHWTMCLTGGICFLLIYALFPHLEGKGVLVKGLAGAGIITTIELIVGSIVNLRLGWNVWDYSNLPFNFLGQICLIYSALWFLLCMPLSPLCHFLKARIYSILL